MTSKQGIQKVTLNHLAISCSFNKLLFQNQSSNLHQSFVTTNTPAGTSKSPPLMRRVHLPFKLQVFFQFHVSLVGGKSTFSVIFGVLEPLSPSKIPILFVTKKLPLPDLASNPMKKLDPHGPFPNRTPEPKTTLPQRNKGLNKALFRDKQVANNPLFFHPYFCCWG